MSSPRQANWSDRLAAGPSYKWIVVGLLFFSGFLNMEDRVVIFSVMPLIRRDLALTDFQIGILMAAFLWTYAFCSPFAGYIADRVSRTRVIVGCLATWSLVTIAAGFVTSSHQMIGVRVLLAVSEAFYIPASLAIVADHHSAKTRAKAVGIVLFGMSLGPILGGAGAGWIGDHYGWRPVLMILGGIGLVLAFTQWLFLRDATNRKTREESPADARPPAAMRTVVGDLLRTPSYVLMTAAVGLVAFGVWMLVTWLPLFLVEAFGLTLAQSGFWGNLAVTGPSFISSLAGGALSDYAGAGNPRRRMLLMIGFYCLVLPWPLLFLTAKAVPLVLVSVFFFQLCRGMSDLNSHPLVYELVPAERRATAIGMANCVNTVFGGGGALIVGYFKSSLGFQVVFGLVPVVIAASITCLAVAYLKFLPRDLARSAAAAARAGT